MAQFSGNAQRLDPYKNFKFRLWDGDRTYFGNKLTGLFPPPDVIEYREGSDSSGPHKSLAGMKGDATTGNQKANLSFSEWASKVWNFGSGDGAQTPSTPHRKDIRVELYDETGQPVVRYRIDGCWVSELQLPQGHLLHCLHPRGPGSIQEQLAGIFEASLRRLRS
jgi:phage tail-like protein